MLGLTGAAAAFAQPAPEVTPAAPACTAPCSATGAAELPAVEAQPSATQEAMEATRRWARSGSQWLARSVDSWFGDKPFEDGGKVTDGLLSVGVFKRQDQGADFDVRFNAHYRLPNAERFTYLFIGRDDRRNVVQDVPDAVRQQQLLLPDRSVDRSFLAGLGVLVRDSIDFRIGLGGGLRPYAQARYDRPWAVAPGHLVDFRETVFWSQADRFGSTTALSYDLALTPTVAFRWLNVATITQVSRNVGWSSNLAAYKSLGHQRLLSFEALANGTGTRGTGVGTSDFGLLVRWEEPVYGNWLSVEFVGGHFWPRPDATSERGRAWAAGANLKMRL
jgi:hypothetical protein